MIDSSFDLGQTPEQMLMEIETLSLEALRSLDDALADARKRASLASNLVRLQVIKLTISTDIPAGETLQ